MLVFTYLGLLDVFVGYFWSGLLWLCVGLLEFVYVLSVYLCFVDGYLFLCVTVWCDFVWWICCTLHEGFFVLVILFGVG